MSVNMKDIMFVVYTYIAAVLLLNVRMLCVLCNVA